MLTCSVARFWLTDFVALHLLFEKLKTCLFFLYCFGTTVHSSSVAHIYTWHPWTPVQLLDSPVFLAAEDLDFWSFEFRDGDFGFLNGGQTP